MIDLPTPVEEKHELGLSLPPAVAIYAASLDDAPASGAVWPTDLDWIVCVVSVRLPTSVGTTSITAALRSNVQWYDEELVHDWGSRVDNHEYEYRQRKRTYRTARWSDTLAQARADVADEIEKLRELVIRPRERRLAEREATIRAALEAPEPVLAKPRRARQVRISPTPQESQAA